MWAQVVSAVPKPRLSPAAGKAGRKDGWRQEVSWLCPAVFWGSVGGPSPLRGALTERHQDCASPAMTADAGMAPGAPLCHSPVQCSEVGVSAAALVSAEQRAGQEGAASWIYMLGVSPKQRFLPATHGGLCEK